MAAKGPTPITLEDAIDAVQVALETYIDENLGNTSTWINEAKKELFNFQGFIASELRLIKRTKRSGPLTLDEIKVYVRDECATKFVNAFFAATGPLTGSKGHSKLKLELEKLVKSWGEELPPEPTAKELELAARETALAAREAAFAVREAEFSTAEQNLRLQFAQLQLERQGMAPPAGAGVPDQVWLPQFGAVGAPPRGMTMPPHHERYATAVKPSSR